MYQELGTGTRLQNLYKGTFAGEISYAPINPATGDHYYDFRGYYNFYNIGVTGVCVNGGGGATYCGLNKAISMDPYYAPAYGNRAILYYQMHRLDSALVDLNEAIHLDPRESGYFINRGLVRYQQNNLRGAMADYDQVVSMDRDNLIAHFNRGLLRFQVGDNNRAIEDFDVVISLEPDNYMAYYNRVIMMLC